MLDIRYIVNNAQKVAENARRRGYDINVDEIVELDGLRRKAIGVLEESRQKSKSLASRAMSDQAERENIRDIARAIKERIAEEEQAVRDVQSKLDALLARVPNMLDPRVPIGGEDAFTLIRTWGEAPSYGFAPQPHEALAEANNLLDVAAGVRVAGSRFYVLKNEAVRLRYALTALFLDMVASQGWQLVSPPFLARDETLFTAGYAPFADRDNYKIEEAGLSLIGTSEQAILGFHMDEILDRMPLLYLGDSMCFRTEAGAAGRDTRGIIRVHQFYKLEQIVLCAPEEAEKWHLQCLQNEERFLQLLQIPYRVIICPSSDVAAPGHFKYDIEAWMPGQGRYREVTSNTNLTDFQTRRGNIRWRDAEGRRVFPYSISATGFCDRHLLALLEVHQQADGSIEIPEALVPFMHGIARIGGQ